MKDKIINFLLIFLLIFLAINFFANNWKNNNQVPETISLVSEKNSYTIPAWVKLKVTNNTSDDFSFNTCNDLDIKKDSKIIKPEKCNIVKLNPWENYSVNYSKEYGKFFDEWEYFAVLKTGENDILTKFEIERKWFISKFFIFFFYAPIYNLMAFLLQITSYSLWWAIILITIILRILLVYPQQKMMMSQRKMQLIQPQIKELQQKYKWNAQMLWMEMMKLYKEKNISPFGSFGLLFLQMPILIVIYHVILSIQDYANMYYLYSFIWEYSVAFIKEMFFWVNLLASWWITWLILAIIVWILQFLQVKLSLSYNKQNTKKTWVVLEKKKDSKDYESFMPDPELINKFMMYWLPIMIWFATYHFFAWLWIYWWISTAFMIIQQLFINKILKK